MGSTSDKERETAEFDSQVCMNLF